MATQRAGAGSRAGTAFPARLRPRRGTPTSRRRGTRAAAPVLGTALVLASTLALGPVGSPPPVRAASHGATGQGNAALLASPGALGVAVACNSALATAARCTSASLRAIDVARRAEGLPTLSLPSGWGALSPVHQLAVVTDAERSARGLPAWRGPSPALAAAARRGLQARADPVGPRGATWVSNMAAGVLSVLQADFDWLYNDGPGSGNLGCPATGGPQCWAHRDNMLVDWPGTMGLAASTGPGRRLALVELAVRRGGASLAATEASLRRAQPAQALFGAQMASS